MDNEYEERIVAYADILGWSNATNDPAQFNEVRETITLIYDHAYNFSQSIKDAMRTAPGVPKRLIEGHSCIEFSYFSDSFSVSAPVAQGEDIFKILSFANDRLLRKGFAVRGGVTKGLLYHRRGIIFGPALVEAVKLEKHANDPAFICSDTLVEYLDKTGHKQKVFFDDSSRWVVNVACGSFHARDDLMNIIKDQLLRHNPECKIHKKWSYLKAILPKMYAVRFDGDSI